MIAARIYVYRDSITVTVYLSSRNGACFIILVDSRAVIAGVLALRALKQPSRRGYRRTMSLRIEQGEVPRRRPRQKGVHQALTEDEIDGVIAMLRAGAGYAEVREVYTVGMGIIRAGLKARGLTLTQVRLQNTVAPRVVVGRPALGFSASAEEAHAVRAYAAAHGMTISDVMRMGLRAIGVLDEA